jgi:hypothetical protein
LPPEKKEGEERKERGGQIPFFYSILQGSSSIKMT